MIEKYLFLDKVETIKATKQHISASFICRMEDLVIEYTGLERFFRKIFRDDLSYIEPKGVYLKADITRSSEYHKDRFWFSFEELEKYNLFLDENYNVVKQANIILTTSNIGYSFFYNSDEEMLSALEEIKNLSKVIQYN